MSLFDWLTPIGNVASGIGSLFGAGFNAISQAQTNKLNEKLTRENWARQDTAYQRQVEDLQKAGLNKALAYGSGGASSSTPLAFSAPQVDTNSLSGGFSSLASGLKGMTSELRSLTREQLNFDRKKLGISSSLLDEQLKSAVNSNNLQNLQADLLQEQISAQNLQNQFTAGDLGLIDWNVEKTIKQRQYDQIMLQLQLDKVQTQDNYLKSKVSAEAFRKLVTNKIKIGNQSFTFGEVLNKIMSYSYSSAMLDGELTEKQIVQSIDFLGADKFMSYVGQILTNGGNLVDIATQLDRMSLAHTQKESSSTVQRYDRNGNPAGTVVTRSINNGGY